MANCFSSYQGRKTQILFNVFFLVLSIFYLATLLSPSPPLEFSLQQSNDIQDPTCASIHNHKNHATRCSYIKSHESCKSQGYIHYLEIFYCYCGKYPSLGYAAFAAWLLILFYLLGNTASDYFCSSLDSLAALLGLSPTIAGVTLLSLGNGAPDVFSSIASFVGAGGVELGLNSVLGGAFVVSSGVAGIVAVSASSSSVSIHRSSFIRDVCFFLATIASLLAVLVVGRINLWSALGFTTIYVVYVSVVYLSDYLHKKREVAVLNFDDEENGGLKAPLLAAGDGIKMPAAAASSGDHGVRHCFWRCKVKPLAVKVGIAILIPLSLPRRLTIPVVSKERWSKTFAVFSAFLSPVFLAAIWDSRDTEARLTVYGIGCGAGFALGLAARMLTQRSHPPARFVFPWLVGGFGMSMAWTYVIAEELVALLVALGKIIGVSPPIMGLTVLAWGNSIGDLIANVALAVHGGPVGTQTAMSGCYAGPLFNTLVGLGVPFVLGAWSSYPDSFVVPQDPTLYVTLAFLVGGLLWALAMLPRSGMMLDKFVGFGLLAIYLCFLSLRLSQTLGLLK